MPDYEAAVGRIVKGMEIGIPKEYRVDGMPAEIDALWAQGVDWLKEAGAEIVEISLPHTHYALPAYYIVAPAEASSNLARYDGVRYGLRVPGQGYRRHVRGDPRRGLRQGSAPAHHDRHLCAFGRLLRRLLRAGAENAHADHAQDFDRAYAEGVDAILTPATPSAAFAPRREGPADPVEMYLNDVFTVTVNMAGLPGIAVPAGTLERRIAARPAADRPPVRRGDAVRRGRRDRAGGAQAEAAAEMVGLNVEAVWR